MRRFLGCGVVLALVATVARGMELADAAAVLDFAVAKNATYASYSAVFTQSLNMAELKMQLAGTVAFKRPDRLRMEMSGAQQHMLMVVGTDQLMWQEVAIGGLTNVMKLDCQHTATNHPAATMLRDSFTKMDPQIQLIKAKERYAFTLLPSLELHGQPMYVLAGELRADAKLTAPEAAGLANVGKPKIFIGQADGFLHRFEQFDRAGSNTVLALEFYDIQLNPVLADQFFVYHPSPGANIIDMTQMILKMLSRSPKRPVAGY